MAGPRSLQGRGLVAASTVVAVALFSPGRARAHFALQAPACWMSQDSLGSPQKLGPCGDEGGGTPTGTVTAFQSGQTITVTINELIFHPGHYRIALAVHDRGELPAEPEVSAGATPCGSVPIEDPPVFPVLADGVFAHTSPFNGPQSVQIKLPDGVTCTHCTLQVIEFMSDHGLNNPGGCFYHHCADISIQSTPVVGDGGSHGGCAMSTTPQDGAAPAAFFLFLFGLLAVRRLSPRRARPLPPRRAAWSRAAPAPRPGRCRTRSRDGS